MKRPLLLLVLWFAGWSAVFSGCATPRQARVVHHPPGGRLVERYVRGPAGQELFVGVYDTTLQLFCQDAPAPDGTLRCLPVPLAVTGSYFLDPDCLTPVAYLQGAGEARYAIAKSSSAPAATSAIYLLGAQVTPPRLYTHSKRGCVRCSAKHHPCPKPDSGRFWQVGHDVPPHVFAEETEAG